MMTAALALLLSASSAIAGPVAADLASERSATVALRALAYDRSLKTRANASVDVVIVHGATATAHDRAVLAAFQKLSASTVAGLPLHVTEVAWTDGASLQRSLADGSVEALWIGDGLESGLPAILTAAGAAGATTLSDREVAVRAGVAIAVVIGADQRPAIFVNVTASHAQGADLASDLLALATVVDR